MATETTVLMKCVRCHYQEGVPLWILEELHFMDIDTTKLTKRINVQCPKCDNKMYPVHRIDK